MLLVSQDEQILLTDPRYDETAAREAVGWRVIVPEGRIYADAIAQAAREHNWQKIGFEAMDLLYGEYEKFQQAGDGIYTLQSFSSNILEQIRMIKEPHEIEHLKKAIAITDKTFAHLCKWVEPGMTEKEIEAEIYGYMLAQGADSPSFSAIIASGPNGSMPHAHPSERQIQRGEMITIDMGARYKGYCADMTRTICLGEPTEPGIREVYDAVLKAMKTAEAGLHGGITLREADALARNSLKEAGLDERFVHGLGHGVGYQIHEKPFMSLRAEEDALLPAGSVVTVEPGVYIPGWSGVRVEDCVLITEDGCEVLTQSPTELVIQE
jgi:Xaa-Pro aminopeptidase